MSQYVYEFIQLANFEPEFAVNPDSIYLKNPAIYVKDFHAQVWFQTLDGRVWWVPGNGKIGTFSSNIKDTPRSVIAKINGYLQEYQMPDSESVVSFDATISLSDNTTLSHYWVRTSDGTYDESNGGTTTYDYLRTNIALKNAFNDIGFGITMTDADQTALNNTLNPSVTNVYWKLRIKIDQKRFYTSIHSDSVNATVLSSSYIEHTHHDVLTDLSSVDTYDWFVDYVRTIFP